MTLIRPRLQFLGLLVLLCGMGFGRASAQGMNPIVFEEYDLSNGLHVILYPDHRAPVLATRVYYHVGSKNEDSMRTGFAHFFEHLMFEATDAIKRQEFSKNIEEVGGNLNAYTSLDQTVYIQNVPANDLRLALWQEAQRMHNLHVDSIGVETQRQVVKEERRVRYENQPYGSFFQNLAKNVFKGTPYEWTPIGEAQYIDAATIKEFQDFYHRYYVPNNATLVVAGDFKLNEARDAVKEFFGNIPMGKPIIRPEVNLPVQTEARTVEISEKMTPLPGFAYAWPTVAEGTPDAYAIDMLTKILAQGNSSRLNSRLVQTDQTALEVSAFPLSLEKAGALGVLAIVKAGVDPQVVRAAMNDEIAKVRTQGITDEEFQKVRNQITKDLVTEASSVEAIAVKLAHFWTMYHNTNRVNDELGRYLAVSRDDIRRVADKYLRPETVSIVNYPVPQQ